MYITVKLPPFRHQMTLEELLFSDDAKSYIRNKDGSTKTYKTDGLSKHMSLKFGINPTYLINRLKDFCEMFKHLYVDDMKTLYRVFTIPKKTGGVRIISAPNEELMNALRILKSIFENDFLALHHASAYAYIHKRSTIDCVKKHQSNESKWFAKLDLHDFFGSTSKEFLMSMLAEIYPFSEVIKKDPEVLSKALDLAFLDGGLPQGTPISPLLTNIMMIPVDYAMFNTLRNFNGQKFVYTRYADDFIISSRYDFKIKDIENYVVNTLKEFNAPFTINSKKTRYGSSAGSNWNLGVMLNKDNKITVGHKNKKRFQAMIHNYAMDKINGKGWELSEVQALSGTYSYYKMVEGEDIDNIVKHISDKLNVNILELMKSDLSA